jgi:PTH1 family peptidyl-tRNA hydrolase
MILIVGLGNPGNKFQLTRHNSGWVVLDLLQKKWKKEYNFSDWKESKKMKAKISQGEIKDKKIILAKPSTFMNLSGKAVKSLIFYYKISPKDLFVIHDDIDIELNKIKLSKNRNAAGHKGVLSIIEELKTKDFPRLRIGIKSKECKFKNVEKFVLLKFNEREKEIIKESAKKAIEATEIIIDKGIDKAMNKFNKNQD